MTARSHLCLLVLTVLLGTLISGAALSSPAYAASGTDLQVSLRNKAEPVAGKKISYVISIKNAGPAQADHVEIEFKTTAALDKITYSIDDGHCYRSPTQVECLMYVIKKGKTSTATITGVMPKKIAKGTAVTNTVTITSHTKLIKTADDAASDNYVYGMPKTPLVSPSASASPVTTIDKATNAAAKVFSFSRSAVTITYIVLGAGILWFIIGLTLRKVSRVRRGVPNDR